MSEHKPLTVEEVGAVAGWLDHWATLEELTFRKSSIQAMLADWRRMRAALEKVADGEHWNECAAALDGCCKQAIALLALSPNAHLKTPTETGRMLKAAQEDPSEPQKPT